MDTGLLYSEKWKTILAIVLIFAVSFLDSIFPPIGIPIAVLFIFLLFRFRKLSVSNLGLFKPKSLIKTIAIGLAIGILIPAFGIYILSPLRELFGVVQETPEIYKSIEGDNSMLILALIISWTTAGFGEELIFRTFFIPQFSILFWNRKSKYIISTIISSIIFGLLHFHNGFDAIIGTTINGFILGLVYLKTNRNIWAAYIAHAIADTLAFLIIYSGLYHYL